MCVPCRCGDVVYGRGRTAWRCAANDESPAKRTAEHSPTERTAKGSPTERTAADYVSVVTDHAASRGRTDGPGAVQAAGTRSVSCAPTVQHRPIQIDPLWWRC